MIRIVVVITVAYVGFLALAVAYGTTARYLRRRRNARELAAWLAENNLEDLD